VERGKWNSRPTRLANHFDLEPIEKNKGRLQVLKRLMKRPDVNEIINACDAGREGELISATRCVGRTEKNRRAALASVDDAGRYPHRFPQPAFRTGNAALADAAISRAEATAKIATAYTLHSGRNMAIACAGYRIMSKVGHHRVSLESTKLVLRKPAHKYADYFELSAEAKYYRYIFS